MNRRGFLAGGAAAALAGQAAAQADILQGSDLRVTGLS
jgi:hypothetical protein